MPVMRTSAPLKPPTGGNGVTAPDALAQTERALKQAFSRPLETRRDLAALRELGIDPDAPGFLLSRTLERVDVPFVLSCEYDNEGFDLAPGGGIVAVTGIAKSAKSEILAMLAGAAISGGALPGGLSIEPLATNEYVVLLDTESPAIKYQSYIDRIARHAGLPMRGGVVEIPGGLIPLNYRTFDKPMPERIKLIETLIKTVADGGGSVKYFLLDGLSDLVNDVNDAAAANELVKFVMRLSDTYNAAFFVVLHDNQKQNNRSGGPRGHLGSELERKADLILRMTRTDDGTFTLEFPVARYCGPPPSYCFQFDKESRLLEHTATLPPGASIAPAKEPTQKEKVAELLARPESELRAVVIELYEGRAELAGPDLRGRLRDYLGINNRNAQSELITGLQRLQLLRRDGNSNKAPFIVVQPELEF